MPGDCSIDDDIACSAAGNDSLTVLLMIRASGRNRYQSAATATMVVPISMFFRVVMLSSSFRERANEGRGLERREAPSPGREAGDRTERREVAVRLDAERVNRRGAAGLQHVQVAAGVAHPRILDSRRHP